MTVKSLLIKIKYKTRLRTRYRDAKKKAKTIGYIYRTNGIQGIKMYVRDGISKRLKADTPVSTTGDVLFITIDNDMLNHYRVDHMAETLESAGVNVGRVLYYNLKPDHIKRYNVFIFYRCPWLPEFETIFKDIRGKNKVSIYAIDDLVIDRRYTDTLPVVQALLPEDRTIYDDGVNRHGKLMEQCDYAVTTTGELAKELTGYKNLKEVYIDRNMRSDETVYHSDAAIQGVIRDDEKIIIGYSSGTNTHNEDFHMVAPALVRLLDEHENVYIKLTGRVDAPDELKGYESRLIFAPFVPWKRLPFEIRECHINLSPLVDSLFNRAKSELKWADAALVEVPTVASNMGACKEVVENGKTGVLVENTENGWYEGLNSLVKNPDLRQTIGRSARKYVIKHYNTTGADAMKLVSFIEKITPPVVAFAGVNISAMSGGNTVVKKHMDILQEAGTIIYGVESMDYHENDKWQQLNDEDDKKYDIFRINSHRKVDKVDLRISFDRFVATFWGSVEVVDQYTRMKKNSKKLYLVQGMEAGFYEDKDKLRRSVIYTYYNHRLEPVTISKWCQSWLKADFNRNAKYAPNGIEIDNFVFKKRDWTNRKIKILIEGDCASEHKRVDESFEIANKLDRSKFVVSYLSNNASPKDWYKVDKTFLKIPSEDVGAIYAQHDILIKSSELESFSYPPLEMMATGGLSVIVKNDGNAEYAVDGENVVYYESGNPKDATSKVEALVSNKEQLSYIAKAGRETALTRDWLNVSDRVIDLYE